MAYQKRVHTTAASRLRQDYLRIVKDPVPYITALPLPSNILEWFVTISQFLSLVLDIIPAFRLILLLTRTFFNLMAGIMLLEARKIRRIQVKHLRIET